MYILYDAYCYIYDFVWLHALVSSCLLRIVIVVYMLDMFACSAYAVLSFSCLC